MFKLLAFSLLSLVSFAQITSLPSTGGTGPAGPSSLLSGVLASIPATCTTGVALYQATDRPVGAQIYACTATDTWTLQTSGGTTLTVGEVTKSSGSVLAVGAGNARMGNTVYPIAAGTVTITAGAGNGSAKVFMTNAGATVVEHTSAAGLSITCTACTQSPVTTPAFPAGSIPLADVTIVTGAWGTVTDRRAFLSSKPLVAGAGIILTESGGEVLVATDPAEVMKLSGSNVATGTYDHTISTFRVPNSTTRPATCTVGDSYMDTDATTGARWYLCESTNTWVAQGGGSSSGAYTLTGNATTYASPADAEVLHFGAWPANQPSNGGGDARIYIPKTGTITKVYGVLFTGGASGTGESTTIAVRKNNTTDTTVTASALTNDINNAFSGTVSIAVTAGDYIEFKVTFPTWATNPTNIRFYAVALIE